MPPMAAQPRARRPCEDCPHFDDVPCFDIEGDQDICVNRGDGNVERNDFGRMQYSRRGGENKLADNGDWSGRMIGHFARNM